MVSTESLAYAQDNVTALNFFKSIFKAYVPDNYVLISFDGLSQINVLC